MDIGNNNNKQKAMEISVFHMDTRTVPGIPYLYEYPLSRVTCLIITSCCLSPLTVGKVVRVGYP